MIPDPLPTDRTRNIEADYEAMVYHRIASIYIRLYAEARREVESLRLSLQSWQRAGREMVATTDTQAEAAMNDPGGYYNFSGYACNTKYEG